MSDYADRSTTYLVPLSCSNEISFSWLWIDGILK